MGLECFSSNSQPDIGALRFLAVTWWYWTRRRATRYHSTLMEPVGILGRIYILDHRRRTASLFLNSRVGVSSLPSNSTSTISPCLRHSNGHSLRRANLYIDFFFVARSSHPKPPNRRTELLALRPLSEIDGVCSGDIVHNHIFINLS